MAGEALAAGTAAVLGAVIAVAGTAFVMWNSTADQRTKLFAHIETLNAKVDKTSAALADLTRAPATGGPDIAIAAMSAKLDAANKSLAALVARIDATDKALADIKSAASAQTQSLQQAVASVDSIKTATEAQKAVLTAMTTPNTTIAKDSAQVETARTPAERELIVVYVPQAAAGAASTPPGLSVRFDKIGAVNAAAQAQTLAGDLKKIIGERKNCVVTVAGYADTLGSDKINLAVSRERAQAVASGLRAAMPGVEVKEVAWGERGLAVWTPDNKSEKANRRVDVNVACKV